MKSTWYAHEVLFVPVVCIPLKVRFICGICTYWCNTYILRDYVISLQSWLLTFPFFVQYLVPARLHLTPHVLLVPRRWHHCERQTHFLTGKLPLWPKFNSSTIRSRVTGPCSDLRASTGWECTHENSLWAEVQHWNNSSEVNIWKKSIYGLWARLHKAAFKCQMSPWKPTVQTYLQAPYSNI